MFAKFWSVLALVAATVLGISTTASAQSVAGETGDIASHRVMVRLTPAAARSLISSFTEAREPKLSLGEVKVSDGARISELLGLPSMLKVSAIKPFIAQNSVVFPDVREKMNPELFTQYAAPTLDKNAALRENEDKVSRWFELRYDASLTPAQASSLIGKNANIEIVEPRYVRKTTFVPNDSLLGDQLHLSSMKIFEAWDHVRCDTTMIIANVDVGVDWTHPDLNPSIKKNWGEMGLDAEGNQKWSNAIDDDGNGYIDDWHGWDFGGPFGETNDNDARPDRDNPDSHGTHTTGISAALANNRIGIAGIAFGAAIMPLKASDNFGTYISFGYEAIAYAANMGVRIVNCSWGGGQRSEAENDVIQYAYSKNTLVIAASGNNYRQEDFYPASYDHVISVGSINPNNGDRDAFSNIGYRVDVGAPGSSIKSTVPFEGYAFQGGTSMAAPQVTGEAALILAKYPTLNAGQLGEMIRASARGNTDTTVTDMMGRGMIDINRAVTDTNLYSTRIERVNVYDDNDDNILAEGEAGAIVITAMNYLRPLPSLKAKIEFIANGEYILTSTKEITFGESNTLSTVKNLRADFRFLVAQPAPISAEVIVKVTFFDDAVGYGPDVDFFKFVINPDYRDLNANNLAVTFDSKGGMGYSDPVEHTHGSGFTWKDAPPEIPSQGRSILYQSGLMMSADETRVVSIAPGEYANTATKDFATVSRITTVTPPDRRKALQELRAVYEDTNTFDSLQVGVTVDQRSYAFGGAASDAIVVDYLVKKRPLTFPGLEHTDETTLALYMDWDIGPSGAMNITRFDHETNTAYAWRQESTMPYIAIRIISDIPEGASQNFHAIHNNGSEGIMGTYDGLTLMEKWMAMTIQRDSAGMTDISQVYGLKDLHLATDDSIQVTYVMGMGKDAQSAKAAIDDAEYQFKSSLSVGSDAEATSAYVYPNPFSDRISFTLPANGKPTIARLIDALGRVIISQQLAPNATSLDATDITPGSYILELVQGGQTYRSQIVKTK